MADEDDSWLYGDSNPQPPGTEGALPGLDASAIEEKLKVPADDETLRPPGEEEQEEQAPGDTEMEEAAPGESAEGGEETEKEKDAGEGDEDDDEDSDDDNVNVVIGDISKSVPTYTNLNVHKRGGLVPAAKGLESKFSIEEFESIGVINGLSAVDYSLDILDDKPWRKPGADITDYFNYGFNEDTWKAYCDRQRRIRVHESGAGLPNNNQTMSQHTAPQVITKRYEAPAPGQIQVVGANISSRRPDQNTQPMHLPPMGIPPPGFGPMQPQFQQPPPFFPNPNEYQHQDNFETPGWQPENWAPNPNLNLLTPGPAVTNEPPPKDDRSRYDRDREERDREREDRGDRERDREDREKERERDERDRRDRHRRSRSRSHARERSRARSRSRSPKKHKKKSKKTDKDKSDKKRRSDDSE